MILGIPMPVYVLTRNDRSLYNFNGPQLYAEARC